MPFILLLLGILFVVIGYRNTCSQFIALIKGDFQGPGNFLYWILALLVIGSIGYFDKARGVANALLALIIVALFLNRQGFFVQLNNAVANASGGQGLGSIFSNPGGVVVSPGTGSAGNVTVG
jgi:hypothetical protein